MLGKRGWCHASEDQYYDRWILPGTSHVASPFYKILKLQQINNKVVVKRKYEGHETDTELGRANSANSY